MATSHLSDWQALGPALGKVRARVLPPLTNPVTTEMSFLKVQSCRSVQFYQVTDNTLEKASKSVDDNPAKIFQWLINTERKKKSKLQLFKPQVESPTHTPHVAQSAQAHSLDEGWYPECSGCGSSPE